jgi:hypothetical protein
MWTETWDTNYVNHYKQPLNIVIDENWLHVDWCPIHQDVRSMRYDITDLKVWCLTSYKTSWVQNKDQFSHVTELLSRVLELEKNIDEINTIVFAISQKSEKHYQSSFEYLRYKLQQYYFILTQVSSEVSEQISNCSHQVQDLLDV